MTLEKSLPLGFLLTSSKWKMPIPLAALACSPLCRDPSCWEGMEGASLALKTVRDSLPQMLPEAPLFCL